MPLFSPPPIRRLTPLRRSTGFIDSAPMEAGSSDHRLPEASLQWLRLGLPTVIIVLVLLGRLWTLQIVQGESYRARADTNRVRTILIPAPRGLMTDRVGRVVAENIPNFVLGVIPADLPRARAEHQQAIQHLATLSGLPVEEIKKSLASVSSISTERLTLRSDIPAEQALDLMVTTSQQPWISILAEPARRYPYGPALSPVLGYIGAVTTADLEQFPDLPRNRPVGKAGLEQSYNSFLTGRDGYRDVERNVSHQAQRLLAEQSPQPGKKLTLTIDAELQQKLYAVLEQNVRRVRSRAGAAVILDPSTGGVLAMVSVPSYDANNFVMADRQAEIQATLTDNRRPLLNRAIGGQYPSGSIIKPMLAAAGLQERIVTPSTIIQSSGGIQIGRDSFPDWKAGGHGATNLSKAIAESVNTYFYILGGGDEKRTGLGVDRMVSYLQAFGWGESLNLDLPGESSGLLPTREWRTHDRLSPWRLGDTYHLSIGQGDLLVTPLQVTAALAAIANNGTLYQPYLLNSVESTDGTISITKPDPIRMVGIEPQNLAAVRAGMRQGVLTGSSRALSSLPVAVAGKTGTAQFGRDGKTHAWFGAFAPYDNPEFVIAVIVEGGGEGHAAALPVAQEVMAWYFEPGRTQGVDNPLTGT